MCKGESIISCAVVALVIASAGLAYALDNIWELEAVDAEGLGTHPKVGADASVPANQVVIEGISLATTGEIDDPNAGGFFKWYSIWVQSEEDTGGIQCFASPMSRTGGWENWGSVQAGNKVRVTGFVADYNGKVFVNDRHSLVTLWSYEIIDTGTELPEPEVIENIAACNYFDQTRTGGGERYQTRWCRINNVEIIDGTWGNNQELLIDDGSGTMHMQLGGNNSNFDVYNEPVGKFDVIGIMDQEDDESPYHHHYRIWVRDYAFIIPRVEIHQAIKLTWETADSVIYQPYRGADLQTWETVGDTIVGNGETVTVYDDVEGAWNMFYKIEQKLQ
jgi:hypothetical protein